MYHKIANTVFLLKKKEVKFKSPLRYLIIKKILWIKLGFILNNSPKIKWVVTNKSDQFKIKGIKFIKE